MPDQYNLVNTQTGDRLHNNTGPITFDDKEQAERAADVMSDDDGTDYEARPVSDTGGDQ